METVLKNNSDKKEIACQNKKKMYEVMKLPTFHHCIHSTYNIA